MKIIPKKRSYRYHLFFLLFLFVLYALHTSSGGTLFEAALIVPFLFISLFFSLYYLKKLSFSTLRLFFLTSLFSFLALINEPFASPIESLLLLAFAIISILLQANIYEKSV